MWAIISAMWLSNSAFTRSRMSVLSATICCFSEAIADKPCDSSSNEIIAGRDHCLGGRCGPLGQSESRLAVTGHGAMAFGAMSAQKAGLQEDGITPDFLGSRRSRALDAPARNAAGPATRGASDDPAFEVIC